MHRRTGQYMNPRHNPLLSDLPFHRKLTAVRRVELHGLEPVLLLQRRARPFPEATHVSLAGELAAFVGDWHGVPVFESYVRSGEVHEEILWVWTSGSGGAGGAVERVLGWWRFFDAVVYEVTTDVSAGWRSSQPGLFDFRLTR